MQSRAVDGLRVEQADVARPERVMSAATRSAQQVNGLRW
jgi:hypothetical protein